MVEFQQDLFSFLDFCFTNKKQKTEQFCWEGTEQKNFLLFPMREFPDESCRPLQMRLYLRHSSCAVQGCNYKIHNLTEPRSPQSSSRVRATLLNSKKTREDALYRSQQAHNNRDANKHASHRCSAALLQRQIARHYAGKHFIGRWTLGKP